MLLQHVDLVPDDFGIVDVDRIHDVAALGKRSQDIVTLSDPGDNTGITPELINTQYRQPEHPWDTYLW